MIALVIHIAGGAIGLVSGTVAVVARKGGYLHRKAGTVFVGSMWVMATFAIYLGFAMPGQTLNVFIGAFALYLVTTAWMTVRAKGVSAGIFEKAAFVVAVCLCAPFAVLTFQLITGLPTFFTGAMTFKGPIVIAIYSSRAHHPLAHAEGRRIADTFSLKYRCSCRRCPLCPH